MPLSEARRAMAADTLSRLVAPVGLVVVTPSGTASARGRALEALALELVDLAATVAGEGEPLLTLARLEAPAGDALAPRLGLRAESDAEARVWFAGAVEGQELDVLLDDLAALGRGGPAVVPLARTQLQGLVRPVSLLVLVTPACPRCAAAVHVAHGLAMVAPLLRATSADLTAMPDLLARYRPSTVPTFVVDDGEPFAGPLPDTLLAQRLVDLSRAG